jgi:hypothetical protein
MTTPELLSFIRTQVSKGTARDSIKAMLRGAGWDEVDIGEAFNIIEPASVHTTPTIPSTPVTPVTPATPTIPITPTTPSISVAPTMSAAPITPAGAPQNATSPVNNTISSLPKTPPTAPVFSNTPFVTPHLSPTTPTFTTPSQAPYSPQINQNIEVHPKKSHFVLILIMGILLLLIVGGGASAYYLGYFESPSAVVATAQKNMQDATSAKFDMTINMKANYKDPSKNPPPFMGLDFSNVIIQLKGASENIDSKNKGNLDLSLSLGTIQASMKFRVLDEILYAMLDKAPTFGLAEISKYQNRWFALRFDNKQDTSVNMIPVVGSTKSSLEKLTKEELAEFESITMNASFIKILDKNGTDTLEGVNTSRYTFDLDKEGILDYLIQVKNFMGKLANRDSSFSTFADIDTASISEQLAKINNFQGEVWIGKKDKFPHKLTVSFSTDIGEAPEVLGSYETSIFVLLGDWNMPVPVEKPAEATDFKAFIDESLGEARAKGKDASVKANLSSIRALAELFYDDNAGSYRGACKSTSQYGGGVVNSLNAINEQVKPASAVCKDNKNNWIAYAPLTTGEYWCVDYMGSSKALTKIPIGMVCK